MTGGLLNKSTQSSTGCLPHGSGGAGDSALAGEAARVASMSLMSTRLAEEAEPTRGVPVLLLLLLERLSGGVAGVSRRALGGLAGPVTGAGLVAGLLSTDRERRPASSRGGDAGGAELRSGAAPSRCGCSSACRPPPPPPQAPESAVSVEQRALPRAPSHAEAPAVAARRPE